MNKLLCLIGLCFVVNGCSWLKSDKVQSAITAIASAGCTEQTKLLEGFSKSVASTLTCAHPEAIQASLTLALGNVSMCRLVPLTAGDVKPQGAIGSMLCPVASAAVVGFMTAQIPAEWGCTATVQAGAIALALSQACETAIPL